ncbi:T cell receptor beta variable 19 [Dissostichus eleginoides]|nr:T cell receptor beta variable 19 [Dissostichus eleginoides]
MVSNINQLIMIFIVCIFLQLQGSNGASYSDSVFQTPPFIMKRSGESVDREINCSHSIPNYDRILWYKQDQHQNMKFLGYLNVKYPYPEDDPVSTVLQIPLSSIQELSSVCQRQQAEAQHLHINPTAKDLIACFHLFCGLVDGNEVYQTEILWRNKGEDATMSCRYTKDASYNQMYWYRQLPGETMEQIVYTKISRKDHDFGGFSSKKF